MSILDKNKVFFGLVHYILSEQKNVNWILKTSLIDFTGISSLLEEKPYKKDNLLGDVIDYVNSVKPYHVQFSHYFEHYETASETISIPKSDNLETTINYRFDAIQTTPDINKIMYSVESTLPTSSEYNKENLEIVVDNKIYTRGFDDNSRWTWLLSDETLYDGIYYFTKTNTYKTFKNNTLTNDFDKESFINSHTANRLFYLGIHDLDELKKELNANFKGLEVNGHTFNIGEFGYELFDYDTNDYDSPTIVYDYCIVNNKETFDWCEKVDTFSENSYTKVFATSGEHRFNLPNIDASGKIIKLFKQSKNSEPIEIYEYELKLNQQYGNYVEIYSGLSKYEKLIIGLFDITNQGTPLEKLILSSAYVIVGYPFIPSNSDVLKRNFTYLTDGEIYLDVPSNELDTSKIVVQRQTLNGSKQNFTKYKFSNSQIVINCNDINEDEHIIITSFDYKYLYDKIYTWEDSYGRSNNIINLDGHKFLRAIYESDRPRELVVSYPLSSCMIYDYKNSNKFDIYYNDYKNDFMIGNYDASQQSKILDIIYADNNQSLIKEIVLDNTNYLDDAPSKILVNSEIIEYNEIDRDSNTIKKLKRGMDGSFVYINAISNIQNNGTHNIGDYVLPYSEQYWYSKNKDYKYSTHIVKNPNQIEYNCPSGLTDNSYISVKTLNKISLLNDITENSLTIDINSCNVVPLDIQELLNEEITTTKHTGNFILKINEDSIPFSTIYKDQLEENVYHIKDFILPEKYKNYGDNVIYSMNDAYIHSCLPLDFTDYDVSMASYNDGYEIKYIGDEIFVVDDLDRDIYRIAGNILYDYKDDDIGVISNDLVYKNDGSIMAKIVEDKFYDIHPVIVLNYGLEKGTAIQIKVESTNPNE